jgi:hypothetical protein
VRSRVGRTASRAIGVAFGLVIGFAMGLLAMSYLERACPTTGFAYFNFNQREFWLRGKLLYMQVGHW